MTSFQITWRIWSSLRSLLTLPWVKELRVEKTIEKAFIFSIVILKETAVSHTPLRYVKLAYKEYEISKE